MIWLLLIALALLVTVVFALLFWDASRWVGDVTRRVAYAERRLVRMERAAEDAWYAEALEQARIDLALASVRTAPGTLTLTFDHVHAKFMARNTLRVIQ